MTLIASIDGGDSQSSPGQVLGDVRKTIPLVIFHRGPHSLYTYTHMSYSLNSLKGAI